MGAAVQHVAVTGENWRDVTAERAPTFTHRRAFGYNLPPRAR